MKDYGSPRWSAEILDCSMPMTFDTYNKCGYNCLYCFAWFQKSHSLGKGGTRKGKHNYQATDIAWANPERVKKMFLGLTENQFSWYIRERRVMQWGGMADQFDEYERQHGITLKFLKMFKEIDYPLCFSTKATWWTQDERYVDLFRGQKNWNVKVSVLNLDPKMAAAMEKGVPTPQERLEAMARIANWDGGGVTLRLRPFIIGMSDRNQEHLKLIRKAKEVGAEAVSTEFFCLERRADARLRSRYREISRILGFDVVKFYQAHSRGSGYLRLNRKLKEPYILSMKKLCDEIGMRFYVSDAHWKEMCATGSCCGLKDNWNWSRGQFTEALMIAKKNGRVVWSDIAEAAAPFKNMMWKDAYGFNTNSGTNLVRKERLTMYDWMRMIWNTPNDLKSPYKYFGGALQPVGVDEKNDVIYAYRTELPQVRT